MADQSCKVCGELFKHGEVIIASVICEYKALKSKKIYAVGSITECLSLKHVSCDDLYFPDVGD